MSSEPMVDHIFARYAQGHKNIKFVLSLEEVNMIFMKYGQKSKQATKRFLSSEPSKRHVTEFGWAFFILSSSKPPNIFQK